MRTHPRIGQQLTVPEPTGNHAMSTADARAFDERLRALVEPWSEHGMLTLQTEAVVDWGVPLAG